MEWRDDWKQKLYTVGEVISKRNFPKQKKYKNLLVEALEIGCKSYIPSNLNGRKRLEKFEIRKWQKHEPHSTAVCVSFYIWRLFHLASFSPIILQHELKVQLELFEIEKENENWNSTLQDDLNVGAFTATSQCQNHDFKQCLMLFNWISMFHSESDTVQLGALWLFFNEWKNQTKKMSKPSGHFFDEKFHYRIFW